MSFNGSGTFVINSSGQPVITGTVISSTAFNALTADLATGLSTCVTKDGQTTTTARIPFAQGISSTLTTDSTSATTGSIVTAGGISTQKALWVGTTSRLVGVVTADSLTASKPVFTDASKGLVSTGTLAYDQGGTGQTTYAAGDIIYASATNTLAKRAIGTSSQVLTVTAGVPTWETPTASGVTSVAQSFTGGLISVSGSPITSSGTLALTVAGTSGGVPYFSAASTWASSAALAANALVVGGGAGAAPATVTTGTGVVTALGVNVGTAGAFVVNGGALGTPSGGTATNLTGLPLSTGVTGTLPVANGGTGQTTYTDGQLLIGNTTGNTLTKTTLTAGTGVTITNGSGTITISAPDTGTVTSVTASSPLASSGGATPNLSLTGTVAIANGGTAGTATPIAGAVPYGTGTAYAFTAAGTLGQVLTSAGAGAPTWSSIGGTGTVTSVAQSFTGGLISVAGSPITTSGTLALTVAGTSGGVPYFSTASTWATSAALAANAIVIGGGAGAAPATTTTGTGVVTALGVNVGTAGAFVANGGALGTPSSGTLTNCTGVSLTAGVTGTLPVANGGTGVTSSTGTGNVVLSASPTLTGTLTAAIGTFSGLITASAGVSSTLVTDATSATTGSIITAGGISTQKALWVGTTSRLVGLVTASAGISSTLTTDATSATTGSIITAGGISTQKALWVGTTSRHVGATQFDAAITYGGITLSNAVTGTGNMVLSANPTITGGVVNSLLELATITATSIGATVQYDIGTQSVIYYTASVNNNWTLNIRYSSGTSLNTALATGQSVTFVMIVTNGATAYYNNAVTIDGNSVTPKYQGGTAWTAGDASSLDVYTYTVIKTASNTYTVLAALTKFA